MGGPVIRLGVLGVLLGCILTLGCSGGGDSPSPSDSASATISLDGGELKSGDVRVVIRPGSVAQAGTLRISTGKQSPGELLGAEGAGPEFRVDLDQTLTSPAQISVTIPDSANQPEALFLAYFDEATSKWIPVPGGIVGGQLVIETQHFSWWKVWEWNWSAWPAALKSALSLEVTEWIQGFQVLTRDCKKSGDRVTVDDSGAAGILEGCVLSESNNGAQVRVINDKTFFVEVTSSNKPGTSTFMDSGDSLDFAIDTTQSPPVQVTAQISQQAGYRLIAELILRLLPARELLSTKSVAVDAFGSLAEALGAIPESQAAWDAMVAGHPDVAADKIYAMLSNERTIETIVQWAVKFGGDHGVSTLTTWTQTSVKKALIAVAAIDVIVTVTDYISNYFFNNATHVRFDWPVPSAPLAFCYTKLFNATAPPRLLMYDVARGETTEISSHCSGSFLHRLSPDGNTILYTHCQEYNPNWTPQEQQANSWTTLWASRPNGADARQVSSRAVGRCFSDAFIPSPPNWSPDGRQFAFSAIGTKIYVARSDGSEERLLTDGVSPSWSPDGTRIAFVTWEPNASHLNVIGTDGTGLKVLYSTARRINYPDWSPDGATIAIEIGAEDYGVQNYIALVPAAGGEALAVTGESDEVLVELVGWVSCTSLAVGCQARVANVAPSTLKVRDNSTISASEVRQLTEGSNVCVVGSLIPSDSYAWWAVAMEDKSTGWAPGSDSTAASPPWLEPTGETC
jgi:hypothetical protein